MKLGRRSLFHFKNSFHSSDVQISECQNVKFHEIIKFYQVLQHETRNAFQWLKWELTQSGVEIWPLYLILQKKIFYQNFFKKCGLEASSRCFFIFKESENACRLILTCFDSFPIIIIPIWSACFKNLFTNRG